MNDISNRYIVDDRQDTENNNLSVEDNNPPSGISNSSINNIDDITNYLNCYPKIIYRVYERYGNVLELRGDFRFTSYSSRESAMLAIRRDKSNIGNTHKVYSIVEEVVIYNNNKR